MKVESISYSVGGAEFQSELIHDDTAKQPRPLLVVAPNWAGVTPKAMAIGEDLAAQGYVVLVADMHGLARRPTGAENPMEFLQPLIKDPSATRGRINAALEILTREAGQRGIGNPKLRAAMGLLFRRRQCD